MASLALILCVITDNKTGKTVSLRERAHSAAFYLT